MNCPERESWSEFVDGELAPARRAELASHLEACSACAARLRTEAALKKAVAAAAAAPAMPEDLRRDLARLGSPRPAPWEALLRALGPGLLRPSVAVSFAAAALCVIVWTRGREGRQAEADLPLDMLLAAHSQYAMTMPLAPVESLVAGLPELIPAAPEGTDGR